jgi:hypothetical protein
MANFGVEVNFSKQRVRFLRKFVESFLAGADKGDWKDTHLPNAASLNYK